MTSTCPHDGHNYLYAGVVWSAGEQRPGSSARDVIYEDKFYCTRCLNIQYRNRRMYGTTYSNLVEGAVPK